MDLGFCFSDNFFEAEAEKETSSQEIYVPRRCEPKWFFNGEEINGDDYITRMKCKADWLYVNNEPKASLEILLEIISKIPESSSLHRDVGEGIARCHFLLGHYKAAVSESLKLLRGSRTFEKQLSSLLLLVDCYGKSNEAIKEILVLQRLIEVHPMCVKFWRKLAAAFDKFFRAVESELETENEPFLSSDWSTYRSFLDSLSGEEREKITCACLVRAQIPQENESKSGKTQNFVPGHQNETSENSDDRIENLGLNFHRKWFAWNEPRHDA